MMKGKQQMFIPVTVLVVAGLLGSAALVMAYFSGRFSGGLVPRAPYVKHHEIPHQDAAVDKPVFELHVHNNKPNQTLAEQECWNIEIYKAVCVQGENYHDTELRWHEEDETQQSAIKYYDIYGGVSHLRFTRQGYPACEHHDYMCQSGFNYTTGAEHTTKIEQWDGRQQPPTLVNYSEAIFHPVPPENA